MIGTYVRAASASAALCLLAGCAKSGDELSAKEIPSVSASAALFAANESTYDAVLIPEEWSRLELPEWGFSVAFPKKPERVERPSGRWMYRCDVDRLDFMLRFDPIVGHPAAIVSNNPEEILERAIQMRADRFAAKAIESRRLFFCGMRTIRTVLLDLDLERLFYWQHSFDHHSGTILVMAVSARSVDGQKEADQFFDSYQALSPETPVQQLTPAEYQHELRTASNADRPPSTLRFLEISGVVADLRVEQGEFDVRHRVVALSGEPGDGGADSAPVVHCSMNGAPWDKLSPGSHATIRGFDIGLKSGMLVNCDIVRSEGEPCPTLPTANLVEEFASDEQAADLKYGGRCVVISGLLESATKSDSKEHSLVFRGPSGRQVVCALAAGDSRGHAEALPSHKATVIGRLSAAAESGRPILISDCYVIEIAKP